MVPIVSVLLGKWKLVVIGVLVAALSVAWVMNNSKTKQIVNLKVELALKDSEINGLIGDVMTQNEQIDILLEEGQRKQEAVAESQKEINNIRVETARELEKVRNEQIGDSCEDAFNWMLEKAIQ